MNLDEFLLLFLVDTFGSLVCLLDTIDFHVTHGIEAKGLSQPAPTQSCDKL